MALGHIHAPHLERGGDGARRGFASERGETLPEMLVSVILMGFAFEVVLTAIIASVNISTVNADRTQASISVQAWAESLQQPALYRPPGSPYPPNAYSTYLDCANPGSYSTPSSGAGEIPANFTASIASIRALSADITNGSSPSWGTASTTIGTPSCSTDRGLQLITLRVESPTRDVGKTVDALTVVKRDQRCPTTFDNADLGPC